MISVSIVIPAHNEASRLPYLLASLRRYLFPRLIPEIIVVVNGSTDGTVDVARSFGCGVIVSPWVLHPGEARNLGIEAAAGEILVFLDADVRITESWATRLVALAGRTAVDDRYLTGDRYGIPESPAFLERHWFEPLSGLRPRYINAGNLVATQAALQVLGGFEPALETGEDVDLCARARAAGVAVVLDRELHAIHDGFPQKLGAFIRRERWHGTGDASEIRRFLRSRVARFAAVFLTLHVLALVGAPIHWTVPIAALAIVGAFCVGCTWFRFRSVTVRSRALTSAVFYCYLVGRSLSLIDGVWNKVWHRPERSAAPLEPPNTNIIEPPGYINTDSIRQRGHEPVG